MADPKDILDRDYPKKGGAKSKSWLGSLLANYYGVGRGLGPSPTMEAVSQSGASRHGLLPLPPLPERPRPELRNPTPRPDLPRLDREVGSLISPIEAGASLGEGVSQTAKAALAKDWGKAVETGIPTVLGMTALVPGKKGAGVPEPYKRKLDNLGLYSKAVEEAHKLRNPQASPQEYVNRLQKAGVKKDELEAVGLIDEQGNLRPKWTGMKSVKKEDLIADIEKNVPEIHESARYAGDMSYDDLYEHFADNLRNRYELRDIPDDIDFYREQMKVEPDPESPGKWRVVDENGEPRYGDHGLSKIGAERALERVAQEMAEQNPQKYIYDTVEDKPVQHVEDGPRNYAERELDQFVSDQMEGFDPYEYAESIGKSVGQPPEFTDYMRKYMQNPESYQEQLLGLREPGYWSSVPPRGMRGDPRNWPESHWAEDADVGGQLASIARENITDAGGRRGIRVLETQSDAQKALAPTSLGTDAPSPTTWSDVDRIAELNAETMANRERMNALVYPVQEAERLPWNDALKKLSPETRAEIERLSGETAHLEAVARRLGRRPSTSPFLNSVSGPSNLVARTLLAEAARNPDVAFVTWPQGKDIAERWRTPSLARNYDETLTKSFLTSARMHDPNVKLGEADFKAPGRELPKPPPPPDPDVVPWRGIEGVPLAEIENSPIIGGQLTLPGIDPRLEREARQFEVTPDRMNLRDPRTRPTDINVAGSVDDPWYQILGSGIWNEREGTYTRGPVLGASALRHHAEAALASMQRAWDEAMRSPRVVQEPPPIPPRKNDPAIYLTPELRQSILEKGFPMFTIPAMGAGIAGFLAQPSPTEARTLLDREYPLDPSKP